MMTINDSPALNLEAVIDEMKFEDEPDQVAINTLERVLSQIKEMQAKIDAFEAV